LQPTNSISSDSIERKGLGADCMFPLVFSIGSNVDQQDVRMVKLRGEKRLW